jgi:hypothetical protein
MTIAGNRQKMKALAILLAVWGVLASWQWYASKEPQKVPLTNVSGPASSVPAAGGFEEGLHVRLELMASARTQRETTFATPRNIFLLPVNSEAAPPRVESGAESAQTPSDASGLGQFQYLGFVRMETEQEPKGPLAVLTRADDVYVVRKGELIDGRVVVKAITHESVTLQDRQSHQEYTVLLAEEAATQP